MTMDDLARRNIRLAAECHQRAVWAEACGRQKEAEDWTSTALEHQNAATTLSRQDCLT